MYLKKDIPFAENSDFHKIVWLWLSDYQKLRVVMKYDLKKSLENREYAETKRDIYRKIAAKYKWRWEIVEKIAVNEL